MAIAITNNNNKIIETSTNSIISNNIQKNEYNIDSKQTENVHNTTQKNTNITKMLQK